MSDTAADLDTTLTTTQAGVKFRHKKHNWKKISNRLTPFERHYTDLGTNLIPEKKRIDYILVHDAEIPEKDGQKRKENERIQNEREMFEAACQADGLQMQKDRIGQFVYTKLHCPFKRLCFEAELVKLEMPLKGCEIYPDEKRLPWLEKIYEKFETDDTIDFVSAPFLMDRIHIYDGHEDPTNFFRPALRSLLTHRILINIDVRTEEEIETDGSLSKRGLPYMLMHKIYTDSYILHDESATDPIDKERLADQLRRMNRTQKSHNDVEKNAISIDAAKPPVENSVELDADPRKDLDMTWVAFAKFQPMWKIRDYFGEKIALYFAWTGMLTSTLWIPTLFGLCIFFYGVAKSTTNYVPSRNNSTSTVISIVNTMLNVVNKSFDNDVTPYFALIICLWGTVFLELWKRKNASLAYEWDVDTYEDNEPDRPQFYGTKKTPDPVTNELNWHYPIRKQFVKFFMSASSLILMIFIVFVSVVGIIVYRVIFGVDYCPSMTPAACLLMTVVISSILNGISILILGKVYDYLALKLTEWGKILLDEATSFYCYVLASYLIILAKLITENHRTQTAFDDALIIKLFAFQFANSYSSCFYIAFFKGPTFATHGILGLGSNYNDGCPDGNCMSQLSIQVLVLMLIKPFPKFLKDIILPFLLKLWRQRPSWCLRLRQEVADNTIADMKQLPFHEYLERERLKPRLGDFTVGEYTEKVIQYGYLMLFAASFPLAPLLALLTNLIDIRVDAKRLLWWNRRPIAFIAQDIGMWYSILVFVNFCGVVSNSFLIAFTSSWGRHFSLVNRLWIVIGFEHIVFVVKFILDYIIPDVPREVTLAIRREKYQIAKRLNIGGKTAYTDLVTLVPKDDRQAEKENRRRRHRRREASPLSSPSSKPDTPNSHRRAKPPPPGPFPIPPPAPLLSDGHAVVSISGVEPQDLITDGSTHRHEADPSLPSVETTDRYHGNHS